MFIARRKWLFQVLVALDQLVNTILGGWADETLSARCYRGRDKRRWSIAMKLVDKLFFWQKDHCRQAFEYEGLRGQLPPEYRKDGP